MHVGRDGGTYMNASLWDSWVPNQKWCPENITTEWIEVKGDIKEHGRFYEQKT